MTINEADIFRRYTALRSRCPHCSLEKVEYLCEYRAGNVWKDAGVTQSRRVAEIWLAGKLMPLDEAERIAQP